MPTTPAITPSDVTFISQHKPTKAGVANASVLTLETGTVAEGATTTSSSVGADYAYVMFPLTSLPPNTTVLSATLRFTVNKVWAGTPRVLEATPVTSNWHSGTIKWPTRPTVNNLSTISVSATATPTPTSGWSSSTGAAKSTIMFDVTSHIKSATTGTPWFGWQIKPGSNTSANYLYGKSSTAAYTPTLVIEYATGPRKPTALTPGSASDTAYVSTPQPTLGMEGNIFLNGNTVQAINIQLSNSNAVNASGSFVTPVFSSGDVSVTAPELQMSNVVGAPAAAVDAGYWWTGRLQGTDGQWSPWGTPIKYFYKPLGVMAITNPPVAPNDYVEDSTPPFAWTLTGQTQIGRQISILDPDNGYVELYNSGQEVTSSLVFNPPAGVLTVNNKTYRLLVRTWDTHQAHRVAAYTGNNTPAFTFAYAYRDFTYKLTSAVTPVSAFSATDFSPKPWVNLSWERGTEPDGFEIVRDNEVIATNLSGADTNKVGTSYSWVDYFPPPNVVHTYEVRAVVNGQTSADNPTDTIINTSTIAWLADLETNQFIGIAGETPVDPNLTEVGTTFSLLNSPFDVRITSSLRGYSGSVSGTLCGECLGDGTTSTDLQDLLLDIRKRPGARLHLAIGNISCPVVIYDVSTYPKYGPEFGHVFGVTFNFHEVE